MTDVPGHSDSCIDHRRLERAGDPHRPGYHFLPPENWMDDPNGVIEHNGVYHLFYQWIADSPHRNGGPFHWGHAVSDDLVHWRDLPPALSPTPDGPDRTGCWSGSSIIHQGVPTLMYTGRGDGPGGACMATSDTEMINWVKHPASPVIHQPPHGYEGTGSDPYVWRQDDGYYCVMTGGVKDVGGLALLYRSDDIVQWQFAGPLATGQKQQTGAGWECANLFALDGRHVLTFSGSPLWKSFYAVGEYRDHRFTAQRYEVIDQGGHFYAPYTFIDSRGRRIMYGWSWEGRHEDDYVAAGWSGVHTIGRVLSLGDDGRLGFEPIEEIAKLRGQHRRIDRQTIATGDATWFEDAGGDMIEVMADVDVGHSDAVSLIVRATPDAREQTRVVYDRTAGTLSIDRTIASLNPAVHQHVYRTEPQAKTTGGPFALTGGQMLRLRVFVDRSIIEVYANGRMCLTSRVYPTRLDALNVGIVATGDEAELVSADVWQVTPIWPVETSG